MEKRFNARFVCVKQFMTSNEELKGVVQTVKNTCVQMATGGEFSYEKYEDERNKIMAYPELVGLLPEWLVRCLSLIHI